MKPKEIMSHDIVITTYGIISNEWVSLLLNSVAVFKAAEWACLKIRRKQG
jgi:hypothetical protein